TSQVAMIAALLSERSPFAGGRLPSKMRIDDVTCESDILRMHALFREYQSSDTSPARLSKLDTHIHASAAKSVDRIAQQLCQAADKLHVESMATDDDEDDRLLQCIMLGYADRLARRRREGQATGHLITGGGVRIEKESALQTATYFACVDVAGGSGDGKVRMASEFDPQWLPSEGFRTVDECFFHPTSRTVAARRRCYWHQLMLSETPTEATDASAVADLLHENAMRQWERVFPADDKALNGFLGRVKFLNLHLPDSDIPRLDQATLSSVCRDLCLGRRSFQDLKQAPWADHIKGRFSFQQLQWIDQHAPEKFQLPGGDSVRIEYREDKPPILAARVQQFFGMSETPRIAGGRVPLLLHLLAPNYRPQQVTDDLASFWENTYPQVRKDLRGRYPKHAWPENPNG
ncbi:MAG: ATP-dependent helicase C-terminal domain-containing protein, partial [Planctomycetota bacterium]